MPQRFAVLFSAAALAILSIPLAGRQPVIRTADPSSAGCG
jgi:hypothetical protein